MSDLAARSRIALTLGELSVHARRSDATISVVPTDNVGTDVDFVIRLAETLGYWAVVASLDPMHSSGASVRDPAALQEELAVLSSRGPDPQVFVVDATRYDPKNPACVDGLDVVARQMRGQWSISGRVCMYVVAADALAVARRLGETLDRHDWAGFIR